MYLSMFIYFIPLPMIIFIYVAILKYMKRNVFNSGVRQRIAEERRQKREVRFIRRILILVVVLAVTSFPYLVFFLLANISHSPLPFYAYRMSFMFLSCGQGMVMLLTVVYTDEVRKSLLNILAKKIPCIRGARVQNNNTIGIPLQAFRTTAT
jgi:hypothetical protein